MVGGLERIPIRPRVPFSDKSQKPCTPSRIPLAPQPVADNESDSIVVHDYQETQSTNGVEIQEEESHTERAESVLLQESASTDGHSINIPNNNNNDTNQPSLSSTSQSIFPTSHCLDKPSLHSISQDLRTLSLGSRQHQYPRPYDPPLRATKSVDDALRRATRKTCTTGRVPRSSPVSKIGAGRIATRKARMIHVSGRQRMFDERWRKVWLSR